MATTAGAAMLSKFSASVFFDKLVPQTSADSNRAGRIVDCHVHLNDKSSSFVEDLVKLCGR